MMFFTIVGIIATFFVCKFIYESLTTSSIQKEKNKNIEYGDYWYQKAKTSINNLDFNKSIEYFEKAISCNPNANHYKLSLIEVYKIKAEIIYQQAINEYNKGNLEDSFNQVRICYRSFPENRDYFELYTIAGLQLDKQEVKDLLENNI